MLLLILLHYASADGEKKQLCPTLGALGACKLLLQALKKLFRVYMGRQDHKQELKALVRVCFKARKTISRRDC